MSQVARDLINSSSGSSCSARSARGSYDKDASGSLSNDTWNFQQHNERWQMVAQWVGTNTTPNEVFVYGSAGLDGYGGSSYIDEVILRERDVTSNGSFDDRYYYLQNWRHDVVAIMNYDGAVKERMVYDAYGRPHSFSPGDIYNGTANRPGGDQVTSADTAAWSTGAVAWNKDIGGPGGVAIPDGVVSNGTSNTDDADTITNLVGTFTGGWGLLSSTAVGNRKGLAGYEFDPILNGNAGVNTKPVYHVRHRVLAADTGKWMQKDPLGYVDGMDLYEYCQSDPLDSLDPTGESMAAAACPSQLMQLCMAWVLSTQILNTQSPCLAALAIAIAMPQCRCAIPLMVGASVIDLVACAAQSGGGSTATTIIEAAKRIAEDVGRRVRDLNPSPPRPRWNPRWRIPESARPQPRPDPAPQPRPDGLRRFLPRKPDLIGPHINPNVPRRPRSPDDPEFDPAEDCYLPWNCTKRSNNADNNGMCLYDCSCPAGYRADGHPLGGEWEARFKCDKKLFPMCVRNIPECL